MVAFGFLPGNGVVEVALRQIFIKQVLVQKLRQIHSSGIERNISGSSSEEETSCIQRLRIKIREDGIDMLFHVAIQ